MTSKEVQISLYIVFLMARYVDNLHLASVPQDLKFWGFFMGAKIYIFQDLDQNCIYAKCAKSVERQHVQKM